jgi:hypothetical protein
MQTTMFLLAPAALFIIPALAVGTNYTSSCFNCIIKDHTISTLACFCQRENGDTSIPNLELDHCFANLEGEIKPYPGGNGGFNQTCELDQAGDRRKLCWQCKDRAGGKFRQCPDFGKSFSGCILPRAWKRRFC